MAPSLVARSSMLHTPIPMSGLCCHCFAQAAFGPAPANALVETLQQAGSPGQYGAVAQHCLASGVLGPLWEEVGEGCGTAGDRGCVGCQTLQTQHAQSAFTLCRQGIRQHQNQVGC